MSEDASETTTASPVRVFSNLNQVHIYLTQERGLQCSYGKLKVAVEQRRTLVPRRKGGFTQQTVDQWARQFLAPKVDHSPAGNAPAIPDPASGGGVTEQKMAMQTKVLDVELQRKAFDLARTKGRYVETSTVERELATRWQVVRHLLESFAAEHGAEVAAMFGGAPDVAEQLVAACAGNPDLRDEISRIQFAAVPVYRATFQKRVREVLNKLAAGNWYTEEMAQAMDTWQSTVREEQQDVAREVIRLAGGNPERMDTVLSLLEGYVLARRA